MPAPGTVKAKMLVLNGAHDPFVKREQYEVPKKGPKAAKAEYRVIAYPGAVQALPTVRTPWWDDRQRPC